METVINNILGYDIEICTTQQLYEKLKEFKSNNKDYFKIEDLQFIVKENKIFLTREFYNTLKEKLNG